MKTADRRARPPTRGDTTRQDGPGPGERRDATSRTRPGERRPGLARDVHGVGTGARTLPGGADGTRGLGAIGTAGECALRLPDSRCEVIVGNVFVGTGAATDLLRAPTWTLLGGEPAADPGLVRVLDMHSGTLHQEIQTVAGTLKVTTFSSLSSPGLVGLRAWGPGGGPAAIAPPGERARGGGAWHKWAGDKRARGDRVPHQRTRRARARRRRSRG